MTVQTRATLEVPFDVLSYPRGAEITGTIVDVDGEQDRVVHPQIVYAGRLATSGAAGEAAAAYATMASDFGFGTEHTMLVTDRPGVAEAALQSGMGVVRVDDPAGVNKSLDLIVDPASQSKEAVYQTDQLRRMDLKEVAAALYTPGEITTVGFVGPTGAGKSTTIRRLLELMPDVDGDASLFEVDAFFRLSRADRKAWLNEPSISDEERADRQRVITWWDLGRATNTLDRIRGGEHVHLEGVYDMLRGGEMVGVLDIDPGTTGHTVFVEGTALLVPEFRNSLDKVVYLNTHDQVRAGNLQERNKRDGYSDEESRARKILTDKAEMGGHLSEPLRKARYIDGGLIVLDNTGRADNSLQLMPPFIPRR